MSAVVVGARAVSRVSVEASLLPSQVLSGSVRLSQPLVSAVILDYSITSYSRFLFPRGVWNDSLVWNDAKVWSDIADA